MKRLSTLIGFLLVFGLVSSLGLFGFAPATHAAPAQQDATPIPGSQGQLINPPVEQRLSQNPYVIGPGEMQWFTFQHDGGNAPVQIWMDPEPNASAGFKIFTEDVAQEIMQGADPDRFTPIGAGTDNPNEPGWLFWRGTMANPGQFYVLIEQGWPDPVRYDIYATGPGLTVAGSGQQAMQQVTDANMAQEATMQQMQQVQPQPQNVPAGCPAGTSTMQVQGIQRLEVIGDSLVNPNVDQALADNWRLLPTGEVHWYTFQHDGGERPVHIWMESEPSASAAGFYVFDAETAESIMLGAGFDPEDTTATGAGTPNSLEPGDLFWQGTFANSGQWYVMVKRGFPGPVCYSIVGAGPGFGG